MSKKAKNQIILFDGGTDLHAALSRFLQRFEIEILHAPTAPAGLEMLRRHPQILLALITEHVGNLEAFSTVVVLKKLRPTIPVIVIADAETKLAESEMAKRGVAEMLRQPLDFGKTLMRVNYWSAQAQKMLAEKPTTTSLTTVDLSAQLLYVIKDISVNGVGLRASMAVPLNTLLVLEIPELSKKIGWPTNTQFMLRIVSCRAAENNKFYTLGGEFIALPRRLSDKIYAACISAVGFK